MGFYGNVTNTAKTTFSFDLTYDTRKKMDENADLDGVFLGRYVLVDYDEEPIKAYYDANTKAFYNTTNFHPNSKIQGREDTVYQDLHNAYDKSSFYKWTKDTGFYPITSNSPYADRFSTDVSAYGRGYDSTVWVKRYDPNGNQGKGAYKYALIAELNAVIPTLHLVVDKPAIVPTTPYFDRDTTNMDYYLHMQSDYGVQIKQGDSNYSDEKINRTPVYWDLDSNGYPVIKEGSTISIDADIYYNKAGFDSKVRTYIPETADNKYTQNTINYSMAQSGRLYGADADQGVYKEGQPADDIYEWYFRLPVLGNTICEMWDKVYDNRENGNLRALNKALMREDTDAHLVTYNKNTVMGMINTTQDLLGYYFIPIGTGGHTIGNEVTDPEATVIVTLKQENGISAYTKSYPVLNCLYYDLPTGDAPVKNYYHYAYTPTYIEVTPNDQITEYYYKDTTDGTFKRANIATYKAKDANENELTYDHYYKREDKWTLVLLRYEMEDSLYALIAALHNLIGTDANDVRNLDTIKGAINVIKDIVANIDFNLSPGKLLHTNNKGCIETTGTYFPAPVWEEENVLSGEGEWVSRFGSVKVRENSENANRKIPKVVEFEDTDAASAIAPVKLKNLQAELVSDNQRVKENHSFKNEKKHDPNTLTLATRDKWIKLYPDASDDSIEFAHTQSPLVDNLSYQDPEDDTSFIPIKGSEKELDGNLNETGWLENNIVSTNNFISNEDGTQLTITPSSSSDLIYNENNAAQNDLIFTIPSYTFDNAGHLVAASTRNYNMPFTFKTIQISPGIITDEREGVSDSGAIMPGRFSDSMRLRTENRWIQLNCNSDNTPEEEYKSDILGISHRLVPTLNNTVTLNGDRRTAADVIPTVYRYGLPADKTVALLDSVNENEAENTFNVPYLEVDIAGHIVAAETHTVKLPHNYESISIGMPSTETGSMSTEGTAGNTSDSLAAAAELKPETLTENLTFNASNKWIRIKGVNTAEGKDTISIGHELHSIISSQHSTNLDSAYSITSKQKEFITQTVQWDNAGHIISHNTETWTLPNSLRNINVTGAITNIVTNPAGTDGIIEADTPSDSINMSPSNIWIRLTATDKKLTVGHLVQNISTPSNTIYLQNGITYNTNEFKYDEAGHITEKTINTYYLPKHQSGDKWIILTSTTSATEQNTITYSHLEQGTAGSYTGTDLAFTEFGGEVTIYGYETDNAGHIINNPTYTLTLPKGSYSNSASNKLANVITGMAFNEKTGAITTTSENVGTLVLTGYTKLDTTVIASITATNTINEAFANLDNRIETEEEARDNAITNLRMFKTINIGDTALEADSNADTLSITAGNDGIVLTPTASNDSFTIGHKDGHEVTSDFYKFSTDAYGHIATATAVTLSDLTTLGVATAENLTNHINTKANNPHNVTADDVGLKNVTNESKTTMFTSPTFTGIPEAPTAAEGTNTTQIATTAFVTAAMNKVRWAANYENFEDVYNAVIEQLEKDYTLVPKENPVI